MTTPHNEALDDQIARIVLMPGDPLRAKFIADYYLSDVICFNTVRNMLGFTGLYKGVSISVMGSGMGMPSIGIYSYELYTNYNVETIVRVGSAGSYHPKLKVHDVLLVNKAYSETTFGKTQNGNESNDRYPSIEVNNLLRKSAQHLNIPIYEGGVHSSDVFYQESKEPYYKTLVKEHDCLAVEMESFALFHNAEVLHKQAACLLTISDSFVADETTTAAQRERAFTNMMEIALDAAISMQ